MYDPNTGGCRLEREVSRGQESEKSGARRFPENLPVVRGADPPDRKERPRIVEKKDRDPQERDRAKEFCRAQGCGAPLGRSEGNEADRDAETAPQGGDREEEDVEVAHAGPSHSEPFHVAGVRSSAPGTRRVLLEE